MRASNYYISSSPCELLNVRTIICQRYWTTIILFLSSWYVRDRVKVLRNKRSIQCYLLSVKIYSVVRVIFYLKKKNFAKRTIKRKQFHTWYFLGRGNGYLIRLHNATELRSSVHSVCNGSCFTLLQKGWIDFPLKNNNLLHQKYLVSDHVNTYRIIFFYFYIAYSLCLLYSMFNYIHEPLNGL